MALLEKQLFVKTSTIPNAGNGLFTKKAIKKGERIIEYKGVISTWKEVKDEDGKNGYIFYVNRNHVINAKPRKSALARYANDARGLVRIKGLLNNCEYETEGTRAFIIAKKDIPANTEILVDYGNEYWQVIRENIKLWKEEAKEKEKAAADKAKKKTAKNGKTSAHAKKAKGKKVSRKASKKAKA
mgnify:CR=1 FL=1